MAINVPGLVSIIVFYIAILLVGIWAGRRKNKKGQANATENVMLAGRDIGLFVGIFTMTATWVGGGYINGTAEIMYTSGLVWCQAPIAYSASLALAGLLFARKMRAAGYVTMLDPFQQKYGNRVGGLLFIPALLGETFWSAAILAALGATVSVIVDLDQYTSIIVSSCIAIFYTLFGGLYSVAYTDVIQLLCIIVGLWLCVPFALTNEAVKSLSVEKTQWLGSVSADSSGQYIDSLLVMLLGGIPWQCYFQRVLASKTAFQAQVLSYTAAVGCFIMAIPSLILGVVARGTAWNETAYNVSTIPADHSSEVLPLVLQYLTPTWVSFIGLGAVSAAVMSSSDSSILSASSMFARNIYKAVFRQKASEREVIWAMRLATLVVGALATFMALKVKSIYALWYLCSDLMYVIELPQLFCVVYLKKYVNTYGCLASYLLGLLLRLLGGEVLIGMPAAVRFPFFLEEKQEQGFPYKTLSMLVSLVTLPVVSIFVQWIYNRGYVPSRWDVFKCLDDSANTDDQENKKPPDSYDELASKNCSKDLTSNSSSHGPWTTNSAFSQSGEVAVNGYYKKIDTSLL